MAVAHLTPDLTVFPQKRILLSITLCALGLRTVKAFTVSKGVLVLSYKDVNFRRKFGKILII